MLVRPKLAQSKIHRGKTPPRSISSLVSSPRKAKKLVKHSESVYRSAQPSKQNMHPKQSMRCRSRQSYLIIECLQSIYNDLNFTNFELFPVDRIEKAKVNIEDLMTFLGEIPLCRYHKDELNLYCETDKRVICVSCVYKNVEHKSHKIKSLQSVEKLLDLEAIRNEEKTRAMIDHLRQIKDDIDDMSKEIAESVMMISRYTFSIIDESIKELTAMRTEMEKKVNLSFNRTKTVISRYGESMQVLINHLEKTMQKASSMNRLSKYMLVKELTTEEELIEQLVSKFNENKQLMEQWSQSNKQFEKVILRKRNSISQRVDSITVTEF